MISGFTSKSTIDYVTIHCIQLPLDAIRYPILLALDKILLLAKLGQVEIKVV